MVDTPQSSVLIWKPAIVGVFHRLKLPDDFSKVHIVTGLMREICTPSDVAQRTVARHEANSFHSTVRFWGV